MFDNTLNTSHCPKHMKYFEMASCMCKSQVEFYSTLFIESKANKHIEIEIHLKSKHI